MIGDYVERLDERLHKGDLENSWSNIVPEYVACSLYLNGAIQSWILISYLLFISLLMKK